MKRFLSFLILLAAFSSMIFAEETFWCLNATQNVNTNTNYDAYRFNYSTVYDLSTYYNYNNRTTPRLGDYNKSGGLNEAKALGTVGVGGCSHAITYTISTTGRFVSQSDPSKYRTFYVVNVPDYSVSNSTSRKYYCLNRSGTDGNAPSTLDGANSMVFTAPATDGKTSATLYDNSGSQITVKCSSIGLDLFLCMANPSSELEHLAPNDDYVATITVSWQCSQGCAAHMGTFNMVVRGYYGSNNGAARDSFLMIVNPTTDATMLDLKKMIIMDYFLLFEFERYMLCA